MSSGRAVLEAKGLILYEERGRGPLHRQLWYSGDLEAWVNDDLARATPPQSQGGRWNGANEPCEQVFVAFEQYAYNPAYRNVHLLVNLQPQRDGVWEFKTDDVRIFGWFYRRRVFIAHRGGLKGHLTRAEYEAHREAVMKYRRSLQLPPPEYIHDRRWLPRDYL